ncbi:MAG: hypothetical protein GY850_06440 [bacterium]|nr:hypothetical protein [bacterium]
MLLHNKAITIFVVVPVNPRQRKTHLAGGMGLMQKCLKPKKRKSQVA